MLDELDQLRNHEPLGRLLTHYARAGTTDREAWQARLMEVQGVEPAGLVKLHGLLIAYGWVEQNTGATFGSPPGVVAQCYRATAAGHRAARHVRTIAPEMTRPGGDSLSPSAGSAAA